MFHRLGAFRIEYTPDVIRLAEARVAAKGGPPRQQSRAAEGTRITPMLRAYIPIFLFILVGIAFAIVTLIVSRLVHAEKANVVKLEPYECGIEPQTDARDRYSVRYYLVAMLFVIFDVETVFMFPWAVVLDRLALFGLIEMFLFILILIVGYVYAWRKGALEWA
jgi:NADH-quinone oxidoreductase subunit A